MRILYRYVNGTSDNDYTIENIVVVFHEVFDTLSYYFDYNFKQKVPKEYKVG